MFSFRRPPSGLIYKPLSGHIAVLCLPVPPSVLTRTSARAYPYPRPCLPIPPPVLTRTPKKTQEERKPNRHEYINLA